MVRFCYPSARAWAALLVGLLAIVHVGCDSSSQTVTRRNNLGPVGPEESFERILARLKRRLEQGPRQSVSAGLDEDANEMNSFSLEDQVIGEVFKPEKEGEPWRAHVTIRTRADYILTRTIPETPVEKPQEEDAGDSLDALLAEGADGVAEDPLSPDLSLAEDPLDEPSHSTTSRGAKPGTQTLTDKGFTDVERYVLIYRDGRWELEEPVDEEKEALKLIFEYALEGQ